ncbi:hypothetical protein F5X99DRAFT_382665 [Biscogniauxia marginata]|nr:hypothetical protein F5X99DRAFT_382665 [Biscogniauxia marginata]
MYTTQMPRRAVSFLFFLLPPPPFSFSTPGYSVPKVPPRLYHRDELMSRWWLGCVCVCDRYLGFTHRYLDVRVFFTSDSGTFCLTASCSSRPGHFTPQAFLSIHFPGSPGVRRSALLMQDRHLSPVSLTLPDY